jgi:alkylhydroperoxidase family enzyme
MRHDEGRVLRVPGRQYGPRIEMRYDELIDRLREAAKPTREPPAVARPYVATVRQHAYRVTDADIEELRAGGLSEDDVFELTVSAAVAAGLERLDAGLRVLG